jgi:hypothetical protein
MTDVDFQSVAVLDLVKHLDQRIATVLQDYMDRCGECGIGYDDATMKAVTVLGHYFTIAAGGIDATEHEIVATCRWHYNRMVENEREATGTANRNSGSAKQRCVS